MVGTVSMLFYNLLIKIYIGVAGDASDCATNAPQTGAHYWLDLTPTEINALSIPVWGKVVLTAMNQYGMIIAGIFLLCKHT